MKFALSPCGGRQISADLVLDRFIVKDRFLSLIDHPPPKLIERHHSARNSHRVGRIYEREFRVPAHPGPYELQNYPRLTSRRRDRLGDP